MYPALWFNCAQWGTKVPHLCVAFIIYTEICYFYINQPTMRTFDEIKEFIQKYDPASDSIHGPIGNEFVENCRHGSSLQAWRIAGDIYWVTSSVEYMDGKGQFL